MEALPNIKYFEVPPSKPLTKTQQLWKTIDHMAHSPFPFRLTTCPVISNPSDFRTFNLEDQETVGILRRRTAADQDDCANTSAAALRTTPEASLVQSYQASPTDSDALSHNEGKQGSGHAFGSDFEYLRHKAHEAQTHPATSIRTKLQPHQSDWYFGKLSDNAESRYIFNTLQDLDDLGRSVRELLSLAHRDLLRTETDLQVERSSEAREAYKNDIENIRFAIDAFEPHIRDIKLARQQLNNRLFCRAGVEFLINPEAVVKSTVEMLIEYSKIMSDPRDNDWASQNGSATKARIEEIITRIREENLTRHEVSNVHTVVVEQAPQMPQAQRAVLVNPDSVDSDIDLAGLAKAVARSRR